MKCSKCNCEEIEFTRMEEIGLNALPLLQEKCEQQRDRIEELEKQVKDLQEQYNLQRFRTNKIANFSWKLDEIREEMQEAEFLSLEDMYKEKEANKQEDDQ